MRGPRLAGSGCRLVARGWSGACAGLPHRALTRWAFADAPPAIAEACRLGLAALEREGAVLVEIDVPLIEHSTGMGILILGAELLGGLLDLPRDRDLRTGEDVRFQLQLLRQLALEDLLAAMRLRPVLREQLARALREVDLLALPTAPAGLRPAIRSSEDLHPLLDGDATRAMVRYSFPANSGRPAGAGSIPVRDARRPAHWAPADRRTPGTQGPASSPAMAHLELAWG